MARIAAPLSALILALAALVVFGVSLDAGGNTAGPRPSPLLLGPVLPGGDEPPRPAQAPGITAADLQVFADRRTEALANRDEEAYLFGLDPARPELTELQRRLFRNLLRVPFDAAAYRVETVQVTPGPEGGATAYVDVSFDHRVSGADTATVAEGYRWTVLRAGSAGGLVITDVDGTPYDGDGYRYARDYPAPWDSDELTVARRDHVVVLAGPATAPGAEALADAAEDAARADIGVWEDGGPPGTAPGFVLVPVADRATFYSLYGGRAGESGEESGLTYALRVAEPGTRADGAGPRFGGARIVVDTTSGWFTSPDPERLGELLRHEMAHALITPLRNEIPGHDQPIWVVEGFADWLAMYGRPLSGGDELYEARAFVRDGRFSGRIPGDAELYQTDVLANAAAYEFAHLAIRRIEEIGGTAAVYRFVTAVYADPRPQAVDEALREATGRDRGEFETEWADRVRELLG